MKAPERSSEAKKVSRQKIWKQIERREKRKKQLHFSLGIVLVGIVLFLMSTLNTEEETFDTAQQVSIDQIEEIILFQNETPDMLMYIDKWYYLGKRKLNPDQQNHFVHLIDLFNSEAKPLPETMDKVGEFDFIVRYQDGNREYFRLLDERVEMHHILYQPKTGNYIQVDLNQYYHISSHELYDYSSIYDFLFALLLAVIFFFLRRKEREEMQIGGDFKRYASLDACLIFFFLSFARLVSQGLFHAQNLLLILLVVVSIKIFDEWRHAKKNEQPMEWIEVIIVVLWTFFVVFLNRF